MGFRQNQDRKPEDFVTIDGETTTVMIKIKVAQSTMIPNVPQNNHFFLFKLIERRRHLGAAREATKPRIQTVSRSAFQAQ